MVTYDETNYINAFNIFKYGRTFLDRLDESYERAYTAPPKEEEFTEILDSLLKNNHSDSTPLSSKNILEAAIRVMEYEEKYAKRNINNVTTANFFQFPVTINS